MIVRNIRAITAAADGYALPSDESSDVALSRFPRLVTHDTPLERRRSPGGTATETRDTGRLPALASVASDTAPCAARKTNRVPGLRNSSRLALFRPQWYIKAAKKGEHLRQLLVRLFALEDQLVIEFLITRDWE